MTRARSDPRVLGALAVLLGGCGEVAQGPERTLGDAAVAADAAPSFDLGAICRSDEDCGTLGTCLIVPHPWNTGFCTKPCIADESDALGATQCGATFTGPGAPACDGDHCVIVCHSSSSLEKDLCSDRTCDGTCPPGLFCPVAHTGFEDSLRFCAGMTITP